MTGDFFFTGVLISP